MLEETTQLTRNCQKRERSRNASDGDNTNDSESNVESSEPLTKRNKTSLPSSKMLLLEL